MTTQPLREMDQSRLNAELLLADKQLKMHRQEKGRNWCVRRCDEPSWPCKARLEAQAWFDQVADELKARARACEDARDVWQR